MSRHLGVVAVIALCLAAGSGRAQSAPTGPCASGPTLYAAGQLKPAFRVFMTCAIAGDSASQYSAAMMMRSGESNDDGSPNWFGSRVFLEQAASQGYAEAIYALAKEYDVGSPAFQRDLNRATELFRQAALQGHVDAQVDLATQYLLGRGGVPQDDGVAAQWYERAAEAGHWGAQFLIASMYEHGYGVSRNVVAALRWYERAKDGGDELAPLKAYQLRLHVATKTRQLRLD